MGVVPVDGWGVSGDRAIEVKIRRQRATSSKEVKVFLDAEDVLSVLGAKLGQDLGRGEVLVVVSAMEAREAEVPGLGREGGGVGGGWLVLGWFEVRWRVVVVCRRSLVEVVNGWCVIVLDGLIRVGRSGGLGRA